MKIFVYFDGRIFDLDSLYAVAVNRPDSLQMLFDYAANLSDKEKKERISLAKKKNDDSAKKIISILKKN